MTNLRTGIRKLSTYAKILLIVSIPTLIVTLFITSKKAEGAWYSANYGYRKPITITYSGSTLTNYDVVFTLDTATLITAGKMQSDCDDIRVTDSDETTGISYWVEGGCNTSVTQIWARVPSIPDGGKTIYVYYGYGSATNGEQSWSGNFILLNNSSCPTGWTSVSGAGQTYNDMFPYGATTYTGGGGGSNSHSHTGYSGSTTGGNGDTVTCTTTDGGLMIPGGHVHNSVGISVNSNTVRPPYLNMVYCSNTDLTIKQNLVALYDSAPSGSWTRFSALDTYLPRGAATYGATGGTTTHTHSTTEDANSGNNSTAQNDTSGSRWVSKNGHYHSFAASNTGSGDNTPPYLDMLYYISSADTTPPNAIITMATATPPLGWTRFSALDSKFPRGNSSYGGTGGTTTHSHTSTIWSGTPLGGGVQCYTLSPLATRAATSHTHSVSWTTDSVSNLPTYINTVYIKRNSPVATTSVGSEELDNSPPNTPTLDSPTDTATGQSWETALKTTATDPDSDYLRYKIELCEDVSMSTNCQTFDQTSSQTGWSGQNTESSTAYTSGTQATYTIQSGSALAASTTYYWRSYTIDPGGTNTWSSTQATPYSFTTDDVPLTPLQCTLEKALDNSYINVNWSDNSSDETGFEIERSDNNGAYTNLDTVTLNTETYQDSTISNGNKYEYRVSSYIIYGSTAYNSDWCYASLSNPATGRFKINYLPFIMNDVAANKL